MQTSSRCVCNEMSQSFKHMLPPLMLHHHSVFSNSPKMGMCAFEPVAMWVRNPNLPINKDQGCCHQQWGTCPIQGHSNTLQWSQGQKIQWCWRWYPERALSLHTNSCFPRVLYNWRHSGWSTHAWLCIKSTSIKFRLEVF